jgi:phage recombination protein Bet
MSNVAVIEPRVKSVLLDMSDRYGMEPAAFEATLRNTVVPNNCTKEQFAAFLLVAKEYKLNPLLKEIYAFPSKGGIQPIVGVDGWANLINSHPAFDGMDFEDHFEDGNLASITCKMYRKDRTHPITATEYLSECKRSTEPWQKWPRRMLRHKAMIQAARYAFSFAGIIDPDEAERVVGDLARDVTPRLADKLAAAQAIAPPVDADGFSREHVVSEIDGTNSNSSQVSSAETDTPASDPLAPNLADAGNLIQESSDGSPATDDGVQAGVDDKPGVGLPAGWQKIYAEAMTRVSDKPKSLATRRNEALKQIGGEPSEDDKTKMRAMEDLVARRNRGELTADAFQSALREIVPDGGEA